MYPGSLLKVDDCVIIHDGPFYYTDFVYSYTSYAFIISIVTKNSIENYAMTHDSIGWIAGYDQHVEKEVISW